MLIGTRKVLFWVVNLFRRDVVPLIRRGGQITPALGWSIKIGRRGSHCPIFPIRALRERFINSYRIESKVKPENVYVDPVRSVTIGSKNIKLDAIYKVLFIFFLKNLEGVETKLIINYEEDLYNIYKEVRDNPNKRTITKMVSSEYSNLETYRTRMNQALVNQLGPKLAEFYILDRVVIKDDYNRYKINLEEGYISIDPPKRN